MIRHLVLAVATTAASFLVTATYGQAQPALMLETIKTSDVEAALEVWCDALVAISKAHAEGGLSQSKPLAGRVID